MHLLLLAITSVRLEDFCTSRALVFFVDFLFSVLNWTVDGYFGPPSYRAPSYFVWKRMLSCAENCCYSVTSLLMHGPGGWSLLSSSVRRCFVLQTSLVQYTMETKQPASSLVPLATSQATHAVACRRAGGEAAEPRRASCCGGSDGGHQQRGRPRSDLRAVGFERAWAVPESLSGSVPPSGAVNFVLSLLLSRGSEPAGYHQLRCG